MVPPPPIPTKGDLDMDPIKYLDEVSRLLNKKGVLLPTGNDFAAYSREMGRLRVEGYTSEDASDHAICMQEVNPHISERLALSRMRKIAAKYGPLKPIGILRTPEEEAEVKAPPKQTPDSTWRREVLLHGCRWANNILVEILGNHAATVSVAGRNKLRDAIALLEEAIREFRGL